MSAATLTALSVAAARNTHPRRFPVRAATRVPTSANAMATGMKPITLVQSSPPVRPTTTLAARSATVRPSRAQARPRAPRRAGDAGLAGCCGMWLSRSSVLAMLKASLRPRRYGIVTVRSSEVHPPAQRYQRMGCAQVSAVSTFSGVPGCLFHPVVVGLPPFLIAGRQVGVPCGQADRAVDEFADDVGLARVPVGVGGYADQDVVQRDLVVVGPPPGHVTDGVERQSVDGGIRV